MMGWPNRGNNFRLILEKDRVRTTKSAFVVTAIYQLFFYLKKMFAICRGETFQTCYPLWYMVRSFIL